MMQDLRKLSLESGPARRQVDLLAIQAIDLLVRHLVATIVVGQVILPSICTEVKGD